jgi:hypoxanthine phosphoribosyltransferase
MHHEPDRVLIDRARISARVRAMGGELSRDLSAALAAEGFDPGEHPDRVVLMPVMTGAIVFAADLIREMPLRLSIRIVTVSSYPGEATKSQGVTMKSRLPEDLAGRHVVIIDDILDSGRTLAALSAAVITQGAASVRSCVLLKKLVPREVEVPSCRFGFEIPDEFVVGYGLDYNGFYRNLPDIVTMKQVDG